MANDPQFPHFPLRRLHRASALVVALFGVVHLGNHLFTPFGPEVHQQVLDAVRLLYRTAWAEPLLWLACFVQVVTGGRLWWVGRHAANRKLLKVRLQRGSGLVLIVFLAMHTSASLVQRWLIGLDSNFYWAAAVVITTPFCWFFVPYYFAGVTAFIVHLGMVVRPRHPRRWIALGVTIAAVIVSGLLGVFVDYDLPPEFEVRLLSEQ